MKTGTKKKKRRAFTLSEILIVLAIIATVTAVAVTVISTIFGSGENAQSRRNAQPIADTFRIANSAGNPTGYADKRGAVGQAPGLPGTGEYPAGNLVDPLTGSGTAEAQVRLEFDPDEGMLAYYADGTP